MDKSDIIINKNCLLKVNLKLIGLNYKKIQKKVSEKSQVSAVLKSNSYGLGLLNVGRKLIEIGCKSFF